MARRVVRRRRRQTGGRSRTARFQWGDSRRKKRRLGQRGKNPLMLASMGEPLIGAGVQLGSRLLNGLFDKIGLWGENLIINIF